MTPKERAAMQQALGALKKAREMIGYPANMVLYGEELALREALAEQAEQEPVATAIVTKTKTDANYITNIDLSIAEAGYKLPSGEHSLYAAPVRTKDLTDDEIDAIDCEYELDDYGLRDFARAVIAADRKLNGVEK